MRKLIAITTIIFALALAGCAGKTAENTPATTSTITPAEIAKQMSGVATALANLPIAPDANIQAQVANYAAWGAFLAKAAATVVGAL